MKAEKNLEEFLTMKENNKVKADITKFTLSRLNKKHYSERTELTGKDGENLPIPIINVFTKNEPPMGEQTQTGDTPME